MASFRDRSIPDMASMAMLAVPMGIGSVIWLSWESWHFVRDNSAVRAERLATRCAVRVDH